MTLPDRIQAILRCFTAWPRVLRFAAVLAVLALLVVLVTGFQAAFAAETATAIEVHLIHLVLTGLGGVATMLSIWGVYWRASIVPEKARQADVSNRIMELEKKVALQEQRLESGARKMDTMCNDLREIKETLKRLEIAFAGSVFKGVGDAHHG